MKYAASTLTIVLIGVATAGAQAPSVPLPTAPDRANAAAPTKATDDANAPIADAIPDTNALGEAARTNRASDVTQTNRIAEADAVLLGLRDPFWPVGYEPPPPEPEIPEDEIAQARRQQEIEQKIEWPALHLKGITQSGANRFMAIIQDIGLVEEGQTISLRRGDMLYAWLIEEVSNKGVMFTRLEARPYRSPPLGVRTP